MIPKDGLKLLDYSQILFIRSLMHQSLAGSQKYMAQVLPVLLEASKSQDASLRQCAAFGLGVLAEHRPEGFQQIAANAIQVLLQIINASDSRSPCHLPLQRPPKATSWIKSSVWIVKSETLRHLLSSSCLSIPDK